MISWLKGLFGSGDAAAKVLKEALLGVDTLSTSAEERGVLRQAVIGNWVDAQSRVISAEYQYGGWLARSWRPILMLMWGFCVTWTFVAPMFNQTAPVVPERLWTLLEYGVLGYIGGRSLEKMTAMVAPGRKVLKVLKELKK